MNDMAMIQTSWAQRFSIQGPKDDELLCDMKKHGAGFNVVETHESTWVHLCHFSA